MNVVGLILSAGESSRMGEPKALIEWKGKTFLAHAVHAATQSGIKNCVVVIGAHAKEILPEFHRLGFDSVVDAVVNESWKLGMGSSIKTGVTFIEEKYRDVTGILIELADQPKIESEAIAKILAEHERNPRKVISAKYDGKPGVPALFPKNFFQAVLNIQDQEGAKKLLLRNQEELVTIDLPEAREDIDTPEQLADLRKMN